MKDVRITGPVVVLVLLAGTVGLAGCGESTPTATAPTTAAPTTAGSTAATPVTSPATGAAPAGAGGIPTGVLWKKTLTEADLAKFGVKASMKEMRWAPDHTLEVIYKFGDGTWTQFSNYDGGIRQPGAGGTFSYAADNELVVKDSSAQETYRYHFELKGDTLSLSMLGNSTGDDIEIVRMMTEGTYAQEPQ